MVPVHVVGSAVDDRFFAARRARQGQKKRPFTFLNISSGFPRKGIDVLLAAYFQGFTSADDVRLVVKTFPNPHNTVAEQIAAWRKRSQNPPECLHIDRDLAVAEVDRLYAEADCLVYPTRSEGFGLPVAEAMALEIPVIATGYSGLADFCSDETAFLVGYKLVASGSHFEVSGAQWAEPDLKELQQRMRFVYEHPESEDVRRRVHAAYTNVSTSLRWPKVAERVAEAIAATEPQAAVRLAMVTSWDERCGIAEYSRYLINSLMRNRPRIEVEVLSPPGEGIWDEQGVPNHVCWNQRPQVSLNALREHVMSSGADIIHFQFNFGFFDLDELAATIDRLRGWGKKVIITFHATADLREGDRLISLGQISDALQRADLLLVHSAADQSRLASYGITGNVKVFPHGNLVFPQEDRELRKKWGITREPVLGTFGFMLPHKGISELLEAVAILRKEFPEIGLIAQCALHRNPVSSEFEHVVRKRIAELKLQDCVWLSTDFLPSEEVALLLQLTDLIILPYGSTAESVSGAVRFALGVQRPVITTAGSIFSDVAAGTLQIESNSPQAIAAAVRSVLTDPSLAEGLSRKAQQWAEATNWEKVSLDYAKLLDLLMAPASAPASRPPTDPLSRLCELTNPSKWTNPKWLAIHRELETYSIDKHVFADDPEMGHRKGWEWTQALYGLEREGMIRPDAKALGVGSGHEPLLFYLADRVELVIGTDLYGNETWSRAGGKEGDRAIVENPASYCPREYKTSRLKLMEMDGTRLEFEDETFDFVWSLSSIEHFGGHEKSRQAIAEMARVIKPGGLVVVATEYVITSRNGKHPEFFDRKDWEHYILSASDQLILLEPMDYTLPPSSWMSDPILVNTNDVHRVRRHVVLDDGIYQWTSGIAFFRKKPRFGE